MKVSNKKLLKNPNYIAIDGRKRSTYDVAVASGASRDLVEKEGWFLNDTLDDITYVGASGKKRIQSQRQQFEDWVSVWKDPFANPYNFVMSSTHNDSKAQMVAMRLFLRATALKDNLDYKSKVMWHQVYGGYSRDKLRDQERDNSISFLVLSNIPDFSTPYKLEKVRDIISKYNSIPIVIATTECLPTEFGRMLRMSVNYGLNIGRKEKKTATRSNHSKYSQVGKKF